MIQAMDVRQALLLVVLCICQLSIWTDRLAASEINEASTNRYNVLFIAVDDLRPELGCYGVKHAQSPHLDHFARTALLFNRHYVQVATCGASRYSLLTGLSPSTSGVTSRNNAFYSGKTALVDQQLPGAQTLPELFRRSGYNTSLIGKISHTPDGRVYAYDGTGDGRLELPHAWDDLLTPYGSWKRGWGTFFAYANGRHREDGKNNSDLWEFEVERDDELPDGLHASAAIEKLRALKATDAAFFMGLGFFKPHLPFVAPQQDWAAFAEATIPIPANTRIDSPYWHQSGEFYKYRAEHEKLRPLKDDAIRNSRRAYLACVRYVDRQIGRVLDELESLQLSQQTVVVIWGDHGWHLGEQQMWGKHTPFERATRSVLLVRVPGMRTAGRKTESLVATVDLYPTLIELCNPQFRTLHRDIDGKSFVATLRHERTRIRSSVRSYWRDAISVRTETHRLVAKMDGKKPKRVELYDVSVDGDSTENLSQREPGLRVRLEELLLD